MRHAEAFGEITDPTPAMLANQVRDSLDLILRDLGRVVASSSLERLTLRRFRHAHLLSKHQIVAGHAAEWRAPPLAAVVTHEEHTA